MYQNISNGSLALGRGKLWTVKDFLFSDLYYGGKDLSGDPNWTDPTPIEIFCGYHQGQDFNDTWEMSTGLGYGKHSVYRLCSIGIWVFSRFKFRSGFFWSKGGGQL